jgi:AbrB family looped-hinge helix DNA binding protein
MKATIDHAGRLVIPKSLRDRLGLTGGRSVEIREREGRIEIEPRPTPMALVEGARGPVAVPAEELPPLTDEIVRATLDKTRR